MEKLRKQASERLEAASLAAKRFRQEMHAATLRSAQDDRRMNAMVAEGRAFECAAFLALVNARIQERDQQLRESLACLGRSLKAKAQPPVVMADEVREYGPEDMTIMERRAAEGAANHA